jgi:hypothetical protein
MEVDRIDPHVFLDSPLLVYRNISASGRVHANLRIRQALGYTAKALQVGEPLVCRSTDKEDRARGFYNNAMFRIIEVDQDNPRLLTLLPDPPDEDTEPEIVLVHIEELDGNRPHPDTITFRLGYAITVHTAQGGEWPIGYLSWEELLWYVGDAKKRYAPDLAQASRLVACWSYTGITRAKEHLVLIKRLRFASPVTPPADTHWLEEAMQEESPMKKGPLVSPMFQIEQESPPKSLDDIPDPVVPVEVMSPEDPLPPTSPQDAPPCVQTVSLIQAMDAISNRARGHLEDVTAYAVSALKQLDVAQAQIARLAGALTQDQSPPLPQLVGVMEAWASRGLTLHHETPEVSAEVRAVSPEGFTVTIGLHKPDSAQLVEALGNLLGWLKAQGYQAVEVPL